MHQFDLTDFLSQLSSCGDECQDCSELCGPQPHDIVLISLGDSATREELIVEEVYENSVKLRNKYKESSYYDPGVIVDNLGPASRIKLKMFGINVPEPPPTPNYETGAYVLVANGGTLALAEVDRVGDTYLVHLAGTSLVEPLTPEIWDRLSPFSDPDGDGNYATEPGPYYVPEVERMIEVVPFAGRSFFRYTDEAELRPLDSTKVGDIQRVETDTLEINAAIIVPHVEDNSKQAAPQSEQANLCEAEACCQD